MSLKNFFDKTFWKFILVGVVNTFVGISVMFFCYNILNFSYWISSALNCFVASCCSYVLNRWYTFRSKVKITETSWKFVLNIVICYLVAFGIAQPIVDFCVVGISEVWREHIAMGVGTILFPLLNYCGQRWFVFVR